MFHLHCNYNPILIILIIISTTTIVTTRDNSKLKYLCKCLLEDGQLIRPKHAGDLKTYKREVPATNWTLFLVNVIKLHGKCMI
jgi:hypothetical protein